MRILIVHPRLELHFEALMPGEVGEKWIQVPALGCLYLREVAREEGHQADYLDADALDLSAEQVGRHAAEGRYDVVGVQLNSYNLYAGVAAARAVRAALPEAVLCAGGVHPTIFPVETANLPEFDAAFAGEAEENFPAFLRAVENRDRPAIPGLAWKGGADPGPARVVNDIDRIPIPKTDGLPLHRYWSALARSRPVMPMVTSRGCPFQCTFCDRPLVDNGLRHRSIDNVIAEIEMRVGAGIREFCFYDDTLTANKKTREGAVRRARRPPPQNPLRLPQPRGHGRRLRGPRPRRLRPRLLRRGVRRSGRPAPH
ncbi:MAG: cobalamin-dependent protein [Deltaproteobacteria bacterium]|nr:cobalamin-dependent protein [Deltaproteobacteria bacterium]